MITLRQALASMELQHWSLQRVNISNQANLHQSKIVKNVQGILPWDSIELLGRIKHEFSQKPKIVWCVGGEMDYTQLSPAEKKLLVKIKQACQCSDDPIIMFKDNGVYVTQTDRIETIKEQLNLLSPQKGYVAFNEPSAKWLHEMGEDVYCFPTLTEILTDDTLKINVWKNLKTILSI